MPRPKTAPSPVALPLVITEGSDGAFEIRCTICENHTWALRDGYSMGNGLALGKAIWHTSGAGHE